MEELELITKIVIKQQTDSLKILSAIENELEQEDIFIIKEDELDQNQTEFLKDYFIKNIVNRRITNDYSQKTSHLLRYQNNGPSSDIAVSIIFRFILFVLLR